MLAFLDNPAAQRGQEFAILRQALADGLQSGSELHSLALHAWGADREAFIEWYAESKLPPAELLAIAENIASSLSSGDVAGVTDLIGALPYGQRGSDLAVGLTLHLATVDSKQAIAFARGALRPREQVEFASRLGYWLGENQPIPVAIDTIAAQTDPALRSSLAASLAASALGRDLDPEGTLARWIDESHRRDPATFDRAWREKLAAEARIQPERIRAVVDAIPDRDRRHDAVASVVANLARSDPRGTAAWLASTPDPDRVQHLVTVLYPWLQNSPGDVADWASQLPAGAARDLSLGQIVSHLARFDPDAAEPWAALIQDADGRQIALDHVKLGRGLAQ